MPGFDEATPRPPRDPAEEAARQAREKELLAKLEALEARAAMTTDPSRPTGDTADSDVADSDVARCLCHLNWFACPVHPRTFEPKQVGSWWEAPIDPPVVVEAGDPVPASPYHFTRDNVTIVPDTGPPLPKIWGEEADRIGERLDAQRRVLEIAAGRDVPPLPVPTLPTGVDDLDSDTYDALRSRYAWLEQRYRDTVGSELAAVNARQAVEIGELRNSIAYKIRAELVCCHHDHGGQCYDGTEQTCHPGCHGAEMAARLAENEVHECGNDTYFDRTVCPEPCGAMHYRCRYCGFVADACPFETSDDTPEQP